MIGFCLGIIYSSLLEWLIHKYLLHTKNRKSPFFFHWHHHNICRKNKNIDVNYYDTWFTTKDRIREVLSLILIFLIHTPLINISPGFVTATGIFSTAYYFVHKKCHLDVQWGKKYFPWHFRHHMAGNQNYNWNILFPLFDIIFRTYNNGKKEKI